MKTIQKTKEPVKIPLLQMTKDIIEKYDHLVNVLPRISNQKFNDCIEDCCEAAKINKQAIDLTRVINFKAQI